MTSINGEADDELQNSKLTCGESAWIIAAGAWSRLVRLWRSFMLPWGTTSIILFAIALLVVEFDSAAQWNFEGSQASGAGFVVPVFANGTAVTQDVSLQLADTHLGAWALFLGLCMVIVPPLQLVSNIAARILAALAPSSWPAFRLYVATVQGPAWRVGWTSIFPSLWSWTLGSGAASSIRVRLAVVLGVAAVFEGAISLSLRIFRQTSHLAAFQLKVDALQTRIRSLQALTLLAAAVEASRRRFRRLFTPRAVAITVEKASTAAIAAVARGGPSKPVRGEGSSLAPAGAPEKPPGAGDSSASAATGATGEQRAAEAGVKEAAPAPAPPISSAGIHVTVHQSPAPEPHRSAPAVRFSEGEPRAHGNKDQSSRPGRMRVPLTPDLLTMVKVTAPAPVLRSVASLGRGRGLGSGAGPRGSFAMGVTAHGHSHFRRSGSESSRAPAEGDADSTTPPAGDDALGAHGAGAGAGDGTGMAFVGGLRRIGEGGNGEGTGDEAASAGEVVSEGGAGAVAGGVGGGRRDGRGASGRIGVGPKRPSMLGLARRTLDDERADSEGAGGGVPGRQPELLESAPISGVGMSGSRLPKEGRGIAQLGAAPARDAPASLAAVAHGGDRQALTEARYLVRQRGRLPWTASGATRDDNGMQSGPGQEHRRSTGALPASRMLNGSARGGKAGQLPEAQQDSVGRWIGGEYGAQRHPSASASGGGKKAEFQFVPRATAMRWEGSCIADMVHVVLEGGFSTHDVHEDEVEKALKQVAESAGMTQESSGNIDSTAQTSEPDRQNGSHGTVAAPTDQGEDDDAGLGALTGVEEAAPAASNATSPRRILASIAAQSLGLRMNDRAAVAATAAAAAAGGTGAGASPSGRTGTGPNRSAWPTLKRQSQLSGRTQQARFAHRRGSPSAAALGVWGALTGTASSAVPLFMAYPAVSPALKRSSKPRASSVIDLEGVGDQSLPAPRLVDIQTTAEARQLLTDAFDQLDYQRCKRLTVASLSERLGMPKDVSQALLTAVSGVATESVSRRDLAAAGASIIRDVRALGHTVEDFGALTTALRLAAMAVWGVLVLFVGLWAFEVSLLDIIVPLGLLFTSLSFAAGEPARIFFMGLFALTVYAPFEVGDRVSINGARVATVMKIEVCATWLRNVHGKHYMVSNHTLVNSVIENFRRCKAASVEHLFSVGYRTTPRQFDAMLDAALAHVRGLPNRWEDSVSCFIKDGSGVDGVINFVVWLDHKRGWMEALEVLTDSSRFTFFMIQTMRKLGIEHVKSPQPIIHVDPLQCVPGGASSPTAQQGQAGGEQAHQRLQALATGSVASAALPAAEGWRLATGVSLVARDWQARPALGASHPLSRVPRPLLPSEFMSDVMSRGYDGRQWAGMYEPPHLGSVSKAAGEPSYDDRLAATLRRRVALKPDE